MEKYVIRGGKPLVGDVNIGGAKNAAVAILPATILAGGKCLIENLPCISDVMASLQILSELGASIRMVSRSTYEIDTSHLDSTEVSNELSRQMRASYYFLGALLGRFGSGQVAMPGGCNLGPRPIDQHLKAFTAFGAEDSVEYGQIHVRSEHLVGGHVFFDTVSVGATMNAMLAAVLAEGTTILENVAREPHIVDLANFLNMMGADVHGAGTDVIKIHGVKEMHGCNYSIIPDQIEAGSYMVAAAITKGDITLHNVIPKHMEPITAKLVADLLTAAGADNIIAIDLHQDAIQGFFDKPVNHMTAMPIFVDYFEQKGFKSEELCVVSPDVGRAKAAKKFSTLLDCDIAIMHKDRPKHNQAEITALIGDVKDKICILNDDMIDTAGSLVAAATTLKAKGAKKIYACATHGLFSGPAYERLENSCIEEVVVTNAVPVPLERQTGKIKVVTLAPLFAQTIKNVYNNGSVASLFE